MLIGLQLMLSASAAAKQPDCSLLVFCQTHPVVSASIGLMHVMRVTVKKPSNRTEAYQHLTASPHFTSWCIA